MFHLRTVIAALTLVALSLGLHHLQSGSATGAPGSGVQAAAQHRIDQGAGLYSQAAHILR